MMLEVKTTMKTNAMMVRVRLEEEGFLPGTHSRAVMQCPQSMTEENPGSNMHRM